jgi:hypothetical protein
MLKKIDLKYLVGAIVAFGISYLTMAGVIQNYIHFSGVGNEIIFATVSSITGVMLVQFIKK